MRGSEILLGHLGGREAAVLRVNGTVEDLLVEVPPDRALPGAIFRALPDRPMKGIGGQFLRLPGRTAFLRATKGVAPGRPILVQVTGFAEPGKAVPVTSRLVLKGRTAIVTPEAPGRNVSRRVAEEERGRLAALAEAAVLPEGAGLIVRSGAAGADNAAVADEIRALSELATRLLADVAGPAELLLDGAGPHEAALRDWEAESLREGLDLAAEDVEEAVRAFLAAEVALPGGGRLTIEPTRALVAVDVDAGGDTSPAASLKADIAAARALPRELRCRGLGGQVTVDFAPIPRRDRQRIEQALTAALRRDPVETAVAGWTPLSHLELRRQRSRLPLSECLVP